MSAATAGNALARDPFADAMPRRTWLIWILSLIVGMALHAGGCWMVLHARSAHEPLPPPLPPAVMIDLAPFPTAPPVMPPAPVPDAVPSPAPPPVPKVMPAPEVPAPVVPAPVVPAPVVPAPRVERPVVRPRISPTANPPKRERRVVAREAPPPRQVARPPARPTTAPPARALAVPMRGPAVAPPATTAQRTTMAPSATTVPAWQSLVLRRLQQVKRYPADAQSRHQQGVAYLRFTMNRQGQVLSARVERSSGFDSLDAEALALVRRAAPLPPPPPGVPGDSIALVVPVSFRLDE